MMPQNSIIARQVRRQRYFVVQHKAKIWMQLGPIRARRNSYPDTSAVV